MKNIRGCLLVSGFVALAFILTGKLLVSEITSSKTSKIMDVNNLQQIGGQLIIYADIHNGNYPFSEYLNESSNDTFRQLFKAGILKEEEIFHSPQKTSFIPLFWKRELFRIPDGNIGIAPDYIKALEVGENGYQYFVNLSEWAPNQPWVCNFTTSNILYSATNGWFVPAKGLYQDIHKGEGITVLFYDGSVRFLRAQPDGRVILGGTNLNFKGEAIRVLRPALP